MCLGTATDHLTRDNCLGACYVFIAHRVGDRCGFVGSSEPRVVTHFLQAHAFVWVCHEDLLAEVLGLVAQCVERPHCVVRLLQVQISYVRVCVSLILSCERGLSC